MYRALVIPLDGSSLAEKALEPAQHILQRHGKITLVMVLPSLSTEVIPVLAANGEEKPTLSASSDAEPTNPKEYLKQIASGLSKNGYEVEIELREGDPADVIIATAVERHCDVIVICTHGYSGLRQLLFGSVTTKVLNNAPCPVLVVPGWQVAGVSDAAPILNPIPAQ